MSYIINNEISFNPDGLDAFGRLRTSQPVILLDSNFEYDKLPLIWDEVLSGSSTSVYLQDEQAIRLRTTASDGDRVIRQTRQYFRYQPGKSQVVYLTLVPGTGADGVIRRWGYYDDNNGLYFIQSGTTLGFGVRTSTSGVVVDNIDWSASFTEDKLDGTGPNEFVYDPTKTQLFAIDFQWLGVGQIRAFISQNGNNKIIHKIENANINTAVYMQTANLPIRYEIQNVAPAGAAENDMKQICSTIITEGGAFEPRSTLKSITIGTGKALSTTQFTHLLTLRPKLTYAGKTNRATINLKEFEIFFEGGTGSNRVEYRIDYAASFTGTPSWVSAGSDSTVEYDTSYTTVTTGTQIVTGIIGISNNVKVSVNNGLENRYSLSLNILGTDSYTISISAKAAAGTVTAYPTFTWREIY